MEDKDGSGMAGQGRPEGSKRSPVARHLVRQQAGDRGWVRMMGIWMGQNESIGLMSKEGKNLEDSGQVWRAKGARGQQKVPGCASLCPPAGCGWRRARGGSLDSDDYFGPQTSAFENLSSESGLLSNTCSGSLPNLPCILGGANGSPPPSHPQPHPHLEQGRHAPGAHPRLLAPQLRSHRLCELGVGLLGRSHHVPRRHVGQAVQLCQPGAQRRLACGEGKNKRGKAGGGGGAREPEGGYGDVRPPPMSIYS